MHIELNEGDTLTVGFLDADGDVAVAFDTKDFPEQIVVKESGGLDGNVKGVANKILLGLLGLLYYLFLF